MTGSLINYSYYLYSLYSLNKSQWLSIAEVKNIQNVKLKNLVKHAYANVVFYNKLFKKARITPNDIQTVEDIYKIPIISREELRASRLSEILSKRVNPGECIRYRTSGTTKEPLDIYLNKNEEISQGALYLRMLFANGYKCTDKLVILTHPQFIIRNIKKRIFQRLGIFNVDFVSIFENPKKQLKKIIEIKADIIRGYTSCIKGIAREILEQGIKEISPSSVFCTSEFLSKEDRSFIEIAFKTKVFDYYSSSESGLIAWECKERAGYHINSDSLIVEFLKEEKKALPEEKAEVVITNLNSFTMPFIRYRTGDLAILSLKFCPCARSLPLISSILGRTR